MFNKITKDDFKEYRHKLGFSNQNNLKDFFGAKDIRPTIDYDYIDLLNNRLYEIINTLNQVVDKEVKINDLQDFYKKNVEISFQKLKENNIISKLNNQGRRPEEVYFSWMRGFITSKYFLNSLSIIFNVNLEDVNLIGDDDLENIETFKRTPTADIELNLNEIDRIRLEVQSGFQGINDIKQHKVLEARKIFKDKNIKSFIVHFDIFNGQVAILRIDNIDEQNINWITRQQMEGQTVFNIDQNYFIWRLIDPVPPFEKFIDTKNE